MTWTATKVLMMTRLEVEEGLVEDVEEGMVEACMATMALPLLNPPSKYVFNNMHC